MSMFEVDYRDLEDFHEAIEQLEKDFPKEAKKVLQKVGNKVKKIVYKRATQLVDKETGDFYKSIKRGKVWNKDGELSVRVYSTDRKKFWIEHGHRIVTKDDREVGFARGKKVFERSTPDIEDSFSKIVETELDRIFDKL